MYFRIDKILNTEQLDTILEDEILTDAEEVGETEDMPGMENFGTNEAEAMYAVLAKNKDKMVGDIGENDEVGRVNFEEEHEVLTGSPLPQELKSGLD